VVDVGLPAQACGCSSQQCIACGARHAASSLSKGAVVLLMLPGCLRPHSALRKNKSCSPCYSKSLGVN